MRLVWVEAAGGATEAPGLLSSEPDNNKEKFWDAFGLFSFEFKASNHKHSRVMWISPSPAAEAPMAPLNEAVLLAGSLPSGVAPPSVTGVFRINLEVSDDTPVTAQPAQLEDAPAGWALDSTSFSVGQTDPSVKNL